MHLFVIVLCLGCDCLYGHSYSKSELLLSGTWLSL